MWGQPLSPGDGHPRRLVRLRLLVHHLPGEPSRAGHADRPVSGRLGPAPGLVSFPDAGGGWNARPIALSRALDPRPCRRRGRQEDVQEPRTRRGPGKTDQAIRRRGAAPLGGLLRLSRRCSALGTDSQGAGGRVPKNPEYHSLRTFEPLRLRSGPRWRVARKPAAVGPLGAKPPGGADPKGGSRLRELRVPPRLPYGGGFL